MRKLNMLIALAIGLTVPLSGQIYFEDFTGQAGLGATINGTSVVGPFTWSVDASQVSFGGDPNTSYFKVISVPGEEVFEGRGLNNGEAVWRSPLIDISGQGTVRARADVVQPPESNPLEEPLDYIRVSYQLDGGPETLFAIRGFIPGNFAATTVEQAGLSGQTLRIIIRVRNSDTGERHRFDKVRVETFPSTPCPSINGAPVFISEFSYRGNNTFVEVSGLAGTSLNDYQLIFVNSGGATGMIDLSGVLTDQVNGMGARAFFTNDLNNGNAGIVLFNKVSLQVVQYLSYGAENANFSSNYALVKHLTPVYTGQETGNEDGVSLQLTGAGFCPEDLTWTGPADDSPGGINAGLILPIELTEFSAAPHNGGVRLSWRTASERDNDYMAVERSSDGYTFDEIGRVPGRGTTYEPEHYTFFDPAPLTGINYYRLRQVDFDGSVAYHGVVSVRIEDAAQGLRVFPTLAREQLNVRLAQTPLTEGVLQLIDLAGRVRRTIPWAPGQSQETIGLADLPPGAYLLRLQLRDYRETVRFVRF